MGNTNTYCYSGLNGVVLCYIFNLLISELIGGIMQQK